MPTYRNISLKVRAPGSIEDPLDNADVWSVEIRDAKGNLVIIFAYVDQASADAAASALENISDGLKFVTVP